jgi:hypothetical protein
VLAAASPLAKDESCQSLSTPGSAEERHLSLASYYVLEAVSLLAKDESCPSLSTPGSAEAEERDLDPLGILGHAAPAPAPTDSRTRSLATPASAACSSCLLSLSTTHPMGSNASVTQLSHPRLSLVVIQEPRVRS